MTVKKNATYQSAMNRIQEILKKIESGSEETDIDDLSKDVEEAASLIVLCKEKLFSTEAKIQKVLESLDKDAQS